jgi:hypothetical protein
MMALKSPLKGDLGVCVEVPRGQYFAPMAPPGVSYHPKSFSKPTSSFLGLHPRPSGGYQTFKNTHFWSKYLKFDKVGRPDGPQNHLFGATPTYKPLLGLCHTLTNPSQSYTRALGVTPPSWGVQTSKTPTKHAIMALKSPPTGDLGVCVEVLGVNISPPWHPRCFVSPKILF